MERTVLFDFTRFDFSDANVYEDEQLLHQSRLDQIIDMWKRLYKKAESSPSAYRLGDDVVRSHNTISITASRGAGKTTFLLSVLNKIKKEWGDDVLCLSPIDPSLVDMKQHPFINLIAAIQEYVEDRIQSIDTYRNKSFVFDQYTEFNECYRMMLRALPFIDGVGKPHVYDDWDDEDFVSAQGMERAEASNNLEKYFHNYIRLALAIMKKKCIVVSFDDIDTDFKKGMEVLETIRKYLTSRQIIVLITGDLELYGKLVRKASWQCFDLTFLKQETEYGRRDRKEFAQIVDQLENQYLVKLLKPEYRIKLPSIWEYISEESCKVNVILANDKSKSIEDVYNQCLSILGFYRSNIKVRKELCSFLLGLPLRVQIRLLSLLHRVFSNTIGCNKFRSQLTEGFMSIFWNDISQKSIHARNLVKELPVYSIELLSFLVENKILFSNSHLLPETNDTTLNKAVLAIGAQLNLLLSRKNYLIFDYWLRISYTKFALEKAGGKEKEEIVERYLDFTHMDADTGLNKSYGLSLAFCNLKMNTPKKVPLDVLPGSIFIGHQPPLQFMTLNHVLKILPMVGTVDSTKRENVFISIYQLFAVLRELLVATGVGEKYILTEFNKLAQYRNYQEPYFDVQSPSERGIDPVEWGGISLQDDHDVEKAYNLIEDFQRWACLEISVSCQFLDRVFTRFYYTMLHIDQKKRDKSLNNAGDMLSLYIIALLNSALVEEAIESQIDKLNFNTVGDIEQIYLNNIEVMSEECGSRGKLRKSVRTLHSWLQSCPLLKLYINPFMVELFTKKKNEDDQLLKEIYRYNRIVHELQGFEEQKKSLDAMIMHYKDNIKWIDMYYAYMDINDELSLFHRMFKKEGISGDEILSRYESLKAKRDELLTILKEKETNFQYNYKTKRYMIDNWLNAELSSLRKAKHDLAIVTYQMDKLKAEISSVSTFVREDYENMQWKKEEDSLSFSVYETLQKITL